MVSVSQFHAESPANDEWSNDFGDDDEESAATPRKPSKAAKGKAKAASKDDDSWESW